jgi:putative SOS response-associated peptidase YedK
LEEQFAAISDDADWSPRYNIAPTQFVPVVRQSPRTANREISLIRWGLVPSWAKDSSKAASMINARFETAAGDLAVRRLDDSHDSDYTTSLLE